MLGFIECFHGDARAALQHMATSEEQSSFDPFLASIQLTRATAHLRLGDLEQPAQWAGLASRHRTAYGQMLYHAALALEIAGKRHAARRTLAEQSVRDPTCDTGRYFGSHGDLPDDIATAFRQAQSSLMR